MDTTTKYRNVYQILNGLISKADADFVLVYQSSIRDIEALLNNEDKSLLRPLVTQDIPFCISKDVKKQLSSLGAVGGGLTPTDLECSPNGSRGTLMELYWQLPEKCGKLLRFQIEHEQVLDNIERRGSGMVEIGDKTFVQNEPQYYEVAGNELSTFVDYLCPGYNYRFRIRSANDAGFGMWSDPIVSMTTAFPFTLEYTKKIHRIIIPTYSCYRITVRGAKAADGMIHKGGKGAIISATISLKAGDVLILLCGGMSSRHHYHSGGGGGSFVALNEISQESLLIAAGGGGGTRGADSNDFDGTNASIDEKGCDGRGEYFGCGGENGGPGEDGRDISNPEGPSWGGSGAGFMQESSTALSFIAGGHAGQNGGFGGGGAVGMYGGGGGGGYSGGGGGRGGGGGGSYIISTAVEVSRCVGHEEHGSIYIEKVDPPYPCSNPFLNRGTSNGTESNASSSHLSDRSLPMDGSSSSLSTKPVVSSSNCTSISTIPESEYVHQSPASTGQVMDNISDPIVFSIDDSDDPDPTLTRISEVFTMVPTIPLGNPAPDNRLDTAINTNVEELMRNFQVDPTPRGPLCPEESFPAQSIVMNSAALRPAQSAPNMSGNGVEHPTSQWVTRQHYDSSQNQLATNLETRMDHLQQKQHQQLESQATTVQQPVIQQPVRQNVSPPNTRMHIQPGRMGELQPESSAETWFPNNTEHNAHQNW